jgi:hypothetical protein
MTKAWGDVMMDGNPNSTCSGLVGKEASLIVVDDPIGCVAPSPGVRVISHLGRALSKEDVLFATRMINMGPKQVLKLHR